MAKKDKSNHENDESGQFDDADGSEADAPDPTTGESVEDAAFIEAEGPDGEMPAEEPNFADDLSEEDISLSDEDLSFLDGVAAEAEVELAAERLADLQRVTAEYANYRKRTEENRVLERERTVGEVVKVLLPVLDDFDRAEKHGDLDDGPFVAIAQKLRGSIERFGLKPFGEVGDAFDPQIHEAIFQQPSGDVQVETVADVVETGYYLGSSLLRAAKVVVAVPNG